jgi:ABC-type Fe3+ transport system permease subunit
MMITNKALGQRVAWSIIFVCAAAFLLGLVTILLLIRSTQLDNRASTQSTRQTANRIEDCTQPGGECFEESQKRTGAVVQKIIDELTTTRHVAVLAAACATDPAMRPLTRIERIDAIDQCVQVALRGEKKP